MSDEKFSPSRLTLARLSRGLSIVQLAEDVELTSQSISNIERGRQRPSDETVLRISNALSFPVSFFNSGEIDELEERQLSFRARTKTASKAKNSVRSTARIAVEVRRWIDERFVAPSLDVPTIDDTMTPDLAAEHLRARWGLSPNQSVSNCIHLIESRGIAVFTLPVGYDDVDAFSFWWRGQPFIILSNTKSAERIRFDAAHELGHLVLHRNRDYEFDVRTIEREANTFAAAFLMPRRSVLEKMPRPVTADRIVRNKRRWRVSALALAYRVHELGLLSEWTFRQIIIELGRLGYRTGEPEGIERETSLLLDKVFGSLKAEGVTPTQVAHELRIGEGMLRDLTFGWLARTESSSRPAGSDGVRERSHLRLVR